MNNLYEIYLISDSTGETLERIFLALKAQFKNIEYKVYSYSFTRTENQVLKILEKAKSYEDINAALKNLTDVYSTRAVNLVRIKNTYAFRTLPYYSNYITQTIEKKVKLSKAAKETLAVIAYHQPVTRTEIEDIRGVSLYKGLMDTLLETKWVNIGRRRDTPGMPVTYVTTNDFLDHFGLHTLKDLPNFKELRAAGFLTDFKDEVSEI